MIKLLISLPALLTLSATCGLSYLTYFDSKVTDKRKEVKDLEDEVEIVKLNLQIAKSEYDRAGSINDHLDLLSSISANPQTIQKAYAGMIIVLQQAIIGAFAASKSSPTNQDISEWKHLNTYDNLWPIFLKYMEEAQKRYQILNTKKMNIEKQILWMESFR